MSPSFTVPPWITAAEQVLGLHETADQAKLSEWLASDGAFLGNPSKMPWCGDFVDTAMHKGLPHEPRSKVLKLNPYWALNWNTFGEASGAYYGAVVTFHRNGGGHVGFLVGESADGLYYLVLSGNQSNRVSRTWIAKSRMSAIRWPLTYANPHIPLPSLVRQGKVSTNER